VSRLVKRSGQSRGNPGEVSQEKSVGRSVGYEVVGREGRGGRKEGGRSGGRREHKEVGRPGGGNERG